MKPDAYMPFYWTKFEASTPGWSEQDRWSYMRAICCYWWTDCVGLPSDNDEDLRDMCQCRNSADWMRRRGRIFGPKFYLKNGRWHNDFALSVWEESNLLYKKKREQTEAARTAKLEQTSTVTDSVTKSVSGCNQSQSQSQSQSQKEKEGGAAQAPALPLEAQVWNSKPGLPRCLAFNGARLHKLKIRRADSFFADNFSAAVDKIAASDFCTGKNDRGWKATFDWILQPDVVVKVMEGKYDNRIAVSQPNPRNVGIARAGMSYGELARRKQEFDKREREAKKLAEQVAQAKADAPAS
jgi:hypothetical protein